MEIVAGFILGIIGTYLFWRFQINIKPKIEISNVIAKGYSHTVADKVVYRIKIFNKSNRQVINISIGCSLSYAVTTTNGERSFGKGLPVKTKNIQFLGPKKNWGDPFGLSPVKIIVISDVDELEEELANNKKILFTVSATDAESGSTSVQRVIYELNDIKQGDFESGLFIKVSNSTPIKEEDEIGEDS